jgi:hypothetical protein
VTSSTSDLSSVYVVGARQRERRGLLSGDKPWQGYDQGLVLRVDLRSHSIETAFEYVPADAASGEQDGAVSLQASTLHGDLLYTCTEGDVLICRLPEFELLRRVSLPLFNDIHHVRPSIDGNIIVANAGLEMVVEMTHEAEIVHLWNVLGEDPWARFSPQVDYRKLSTKPHRAHPNFVFYIGQELWATRFHQGDAISLAAPERRIPVSSNRIHDGVVVDGRVYFTVVDGHVIVTDGASLQVIDVIDLNEFHDDRAVLGWCRGILVDATRLWVGFSRIRATKFRENVGWIARGFRRDRETRIACYDLDRRQCVAEIDLEPTGLAAVYSILPAAPVPAGEAS